MPDAFPVERVRERSRALFGGAQYRLEIGAAIARGDGVVCIKDLTDELAAAYRDAPGHASVNNELKVLERAELLVRGSRERSERRVYLLRQPSHYWTFCAEVCDSAATAPKS